MSAILTSVNLVMSVVRPSLLYSSNMVLASSSTTPATIFGTAAPSETVTLNDSRAGMTHAPVTADANSGKWIIALAPHVAVKGEASFTLELSGSSIGSTPITARNVAYGDVILCSGQSNMALELASAYNASTIIAAANRPEIRLFLVEKLAAPAPLERLNNYSVGSAGLGTFWALTTPVSVPQFSGICYLTALNLQKLHHAGDRGAVYGLIDAAVGSTDVQSWMSIEGRTTALKTCWTPSSMNNATTLPDSHSNAGGDPKNSGLYNAMIAPLAPFALSAVLWDQGENNAHYCTESEYNCLFTSMVNDWRHRVWKIPSGEEHLLPFAWVQIGVYSSPSAYGIAANANIRFAQQDSLPIGTDQIFTNRSHNGSKFSLPVSAMASTFDLGSPENVSKCDATRPSPACWWIHCRNKTEVTRRLALQLAHVWTAPGGTPLPQSQEWSGAIVKSVSKVAVKGKKPYAVITFTHGLGLTLRGAQGCFHCCNQTSPGPMESTRKDYAFEVANRKGDWLPATGEVQPDGTLVVTPHSPVTSNGWLSAVRYAVMDIPQCILYNDAEIPASAFEFPVPYDTVRSVNI